MPSVRSSPGEGGAGDPLESREGRREPHGRPWRENAHRCRGSARRRGPPARHALRGRRSGQLAAVTCTSAPRSTNAASRGDEVGAQVTLGMGDQAAKPPRRQAVDRRGQGVAKRPGRRLEQDPAAPAPSEAARSSPSEGARRPSRPPRRRRPLAGRSRALELLRHLGHARGKLVQAHVVVMADVRRRADRVDAVFPGLTGHGHAVVEVDGAIVEPGQDVAVEVDQTGRGAALSALGPWRDAQRMSRRCPRRQTRPRFDRVGPSRSRRDALRRRQRSVGKQDESGVSGVGRHRGSFRLRASSLRLTKPVAMLCTV